MLTTTLAVGRRKFDTYAAMEQQLEASRQLRAEVLADGVASALTALSGAIRNIMLRITAKIQD